MKIEVGKFYKTKLGEKVRIYAIDGEGPFVVHGAFASLEGEWVLESWNITGKYGFYKENTILDIVSEWEEPKHNHPYRRVIQHVQSPLDPYWGYETFKYRDTKYNSIAEYFGNVPSVKINPVTKELMENANKRMKNRLLTVEELDKENYKTIIKAQYIEPTGEVVKLKTDDSGKINYTPIPYEQLDLGGFESFSESLDYVKQFWSDSSVLNIAINELDEMNKVYTPLTPYSGTITHSTPCSHSWKSYTGLSETYSYCEKCDEKKK